MFIKIENLTTIRDSVYSMRDDGQSLVWTEEQALLLYDSMDKGFPIGNILFWKAGFQSRHYIMDGVQRLAALTGMLPGGEVVWQPRWHVTAQKWTFEDTPHAIPVWAEPSAQYKAFMALSEQSSNLLDIAFGRIQDFRLRRIPIYFLDGMSLPDAHEAMRRLHSAGTKYQSQAFRKGQ